MNHLLMDHFHHETSRQNIYIYIIYSLLILTLSGQSIAADPNILVDEVDEVEGGGMGSEGAEIEAISSVGAEGTEGTDASVVTIF